MTAVLAGLLAPVVPVAPVGGGLLAGVESTLVLMVFWDAANVDKECNSNLLKSMGIDGGLGIFDLHQTNHQISIRIETKWQHLMNESNTYNNVMTKLCVDLIKCGKLQINPAITYGALPSNTSRILPEVNFCFNSNKNSFTTGNPKAVLVVAIATFAAQNGYYKIYI